MHLACQLADLGVDTVLRCMHALSLVTADILQDIARPGIITVLQQLDVLPGQLHPDVFLVHTYRLLAQRNH